MADEATFPHKCERGRKFDIQTGNTLRRNGHRLFVLPDLVSQTTWRGDPTRNCNGRVTGRSLWTNIAYERDRSLNKDRRWETLTLPGANAHVPAGADAVLVLERCHHPWSFRKRRLFVNGMPSAPTVLPPGSNQDETLKATAARWKTTSRTSKRRQERRKRDLAAELAKVPQEGHVVVQVERFTPNAKDLHSQVGFSNGGSWSRGGSPKSRRLARKRELSQLLK